MTGHNLRHLVDRGIAAAEEWQRAWERKQERDGTVYVDGTFDLDTLSRAAGAAVFDWLADHIDADDPNTDLAWLRKEALGE